MKRELWLLDRDIMQRVYKNAFMQHKCGKDCPLRIDGECSLEMIKEQEEPQKRLSKVDQWVRAHSHNEVNL